MKSLLSKGKRKREVVQWILNIVVHSNYSENIERYRKIIQQRIVAVKEEANRKYGNLVESIPLRLKQIAEQKEAAVRAEDDRKQNWTAQTFPQFLSSNLHQI